MLSSFEQGVMIAWAEMGITIDDIRGFPNNICVYIYVPKQSYIKHENGNEMSGDYLASQFKKKYAPMYEKELVVKYKIRDEIWTKSDSERAVLELRKQMSENRYD